MNRKYSFIIPVFNRPQETLELLESFTKIRFSEPYEIVLVEDGSSDTSEAIAQSFADKLSISYYFKENTGPGDSRNFGMQKAQGNYFIILDSDVLMPPDYLEVVDTYLDKNYIDCYGGADAAHQDFSPLQKAINYVMTSFLTTGGIRGNKVAVQNFEPRSFNMGISKRAFEATQGFAKIHPGEDPDLSQRIRKTGFATAFIPDAAVYHKRRISWKKFYVQVNKFGMVRPILNLWHPQAAKLTFWFPTMFIIFVILSVVGALIWEEKILLPLLAYVLILFLDATRKSKSAYIGFLAIVAMFIQFFGYGWGFFKSTFYIQLLKRNPEKQFPHLFFK